MLAMRKSNVHPTKMRVAVYARVSPWDDSQTITNQIQLFKTYVNEHDWELYDIYTDEEFGPKSNRSGIPRLTDRNGFQELIRDANDKKFDIVLIKATTRLTRKDLTLDQTLILNQIHFITIDGEINTLEDDQLNVVELLTRLDKKTVASFISNRVKDSYVARSLKGCCHKAPYGYTLKDGKLLLANDGTSEIVKRIYKEYIEGKSFNAIARSLANEGVPTPAQTKGFKNTGMCWQGSTIRQILERDIYVGRLVARKTTISPTTNKRIINKPKNWIINENTHEAIISKEEFDVVQQLIKARKRTRSKK